jgi:hypothetical protein
VRRLHVIAWCCCAGAGEEQTAFVAACREAIKVGNMRQLYELLRTSVA